MRKYLLLPAITHLVAEPGHHLGAVLLGVCEHGSGAVGAEPGAACSQNHVTITYQPLISGYKAVCLFAVAMLQGYQQDDYKG